MSSRLTRTSLRSLKEAGLRLAFLSNMTPKTLDAAIRNSG